MVLVFYVYIRSMNVTDLFLVAWEIDEVAELLVDRSFYKCQFINY